MKYDVAVIGAGPSGIFSAFSSSKNGNKTILIDSGNKYKNKICDSYLSYINNPNLKEPICNGRCLGGFGGSSMHFEVNLDNYQNNYSSSLVELLGYDIVNEYSQKVFNFLQKLGLSLEISNTKKEKIRYNNIKINPTESIPITFNELNKIMFKLEEIITDNCEEILFGERLTDIEKKEDYWKIITEDNVIETDKIILAIGKRGIVKNFNLLNKLGVLYEFPDKIMLGIRIETQREWLKNLLIKNPNPKIIFSSNDSYIRSFCFCDGGRIMKYKIGSEISVDGQHGHTSKTEKTNFAILNEIIVPENRNSIYYALKYSKDINSLSYNEKLPIQSYNDYILKKPSKKESILEFNPTFEGICGCDFNKVLDNYEIEIKPFINSMEKIFGDIPFQSFLTGPVFEKFLPRIKLNNHLRSSTKGIYFVGDCTGKIQGVISGAVSGLFVGNNV